MSSIHEKLSESSTLEKLPGPSQEEHNDASPEQQHQVFRSKDTQAAKKSKAIDQALEEDGKIRKRRCNVLPLGAFKMREIIQQLKSDDEIGLTREELVDYRHNIHQWVVACTRELVNSVKTSDSRLEPGTRIHYDHLCGYLSDLDSDAQLSKDFGKAVEGLWKDSILKKAFLSNKEPESENSTAYAFENISRITTSNYTPTEADILQSHDGIRGTTEYRFTTDDVSIRLIDVGLQIGERRKWFHQFYDITAILFAADLSQHHFCEDMSRQEVITNQLHLFDSVVNSKWFPNTIFILFLSNVSGFRRDLEVSPLQESFPDYTGENSVEEAGEYLLQRFREINRAQRTLYSYLVDLEPYDPGNLELLFAAIKDAIGASSRSEASDEVY